MKIFLDIVFKIIMKSYEFETTYYYVKNTKDVSPNYDLYDIFSLQTNLKNKYSNLDIHVEDRQKGNKVFTFVIVETEFNLSPIQQKQITNDIDYFTGENKSFVILFPFDRKLYTPNGYPISQIISNQLIQLVDLRFQFKADDLILFSDVQDESEFDKLQTDNFLVNYDYNEYGLLVDLSKTGYFSNLYDLLFQYYYKQVVEMFEQGYIVCDEKFAERFNLIKKRDNIYFQDWKLYYLFKDKNMTEFLMQLQEDDSAYFTIVGIDNIDKYYIAEYLGDTDYKFYDSGLWISYVPDFEFIFELANTIEKCKNVMNCEIEHSNEEKEGMIGIKMFKNGYHSKVKCD